MNIIRQIVEAMSAVVDTYFGSDMEVMSSEARRILSNPTDRKKYLDAVDRLKTDSTEETIQLSTGEIITLVS